MIQNFPSYSKVYIEVDKALDHVFLTVNGSERMRWGMTSVEHWGLSNPPMARVGEKIDITSLLAQGANDVKLVAVAHSGEAGMGGYNIKLWGDATPLLNAQQDVALTGNFKSVLFEQKLTVNLSSGPAKRNLTVGALNGGEAIYLNNVYSGKFAPASFSLTPGEYRVGLGVSSAVISGDNYFPSGQYREQDVLLADQDLSLRAADMPVQTKVNTWKVAVVPFMLMHHGLTAAQARAGLSAPADDIGVFSSDDVTVAEQVIRATSDQWLLPMSYGMMKWDIKMLAPITQRTYRTVDQDVLFDGVTFSEDLSPYDLVFFLLPTRTAAGPYVVHGFGGYAGRPYGYISTNFIDVEGTSLADRLAKVQPSTGLLHESLHNYDNYRLYDYTGVDQLHGAEEHGYGPNDCGLPSGWLCWYQNYIRGQVGENMTVQANVATSTKVAMNDASTFVGLFNLMRAGRGAEQVWSYSKPVSRIQNVGTSNCLDLGVASSADNVALLTASCQLQATQRWSFKRVQNGAHHLVNDSTQKCADASSGTLLQTTCTTALSLRYLFEPSNNGSFSVKTLNGQCLEVNNSAGVSVVPCNVSQTKQSWRFN